MTDDQRNAVTPKPDAAGPQGELVISGVDTGPAEAQRENLTPTEEHVRFQPLSHEDPDTEDL